MATQEKRSEILQSRIFSVMNEEFFAMVGKDSQVAIATSKEVTELTKKLAIAKANAVFGDETAKSSNLLVAEKVVSLFLKSHGCKFAKGAWDDKGQTILANLKSSIFVDGCPAQGVIKGGQIENVNLQLVDTTARAASWLGWIEDTYKLLTGTARKTRETTCEKATAYVAQAHKFVSLSQAVKRAARNYKLSEESLRSYFARKIQKQRIVNAAKVSAKSNRKK